MQTVTYNPVTRSWVVRRWDSAVGAFVVVEVGNMIPTGTTTVATTPSSQGWADITRTSMPYWRMQWEAEAVERAREILLEAKEVGPDPELFGSGHVVPEGWVEYQGRWQDPRGVIEQLEEIAADTDEGATIRVSADLYREFGEWLVARGRLTMRDLTYSVALHFCGHRLEVRR